MAKCCVLLQILHHLLANQWASTLSVDGSETSFERASKGRQHLLEPEAVMAGSGRQIRSLPKAWFRSRCIDP